MVDKLNIAIIMGSLRKESINKKLAHAIEQLAPDNVTFTHADISSLPLYNQDDDANQAESVKTFKAVIEAADGIIIVTPEYNRSLPGVLKNALDHGSRPWGHNSWDGKPAAIIGLSPGKMGTALAQQHLRNISVGLGLKLMGQPEAYLQNSEGFLTVDGEIGPQSRDFVKGWLDKAIAWFEKMKSD